MLRSGTRNEVVLLHVSQAAQTQRDCSRPDGSARPTASENFQSEDAISGCRSWGGISHNEPGKREQGITPRISEGGEGRGNEALEIRGLLKQARVVSAKMHEALGALRATRRQRREK